MTALSNSKKFILFGVLILIAGIGGWFVYSFLNPTYNVNGRFTDADNGEPVQGVVLKVEDKEVKSDQNGNYSLNGISEDASIEINTPEAYKPKDAGLDYSASGKVDWNTRELNKDFSLQITKDEKKKRLIQDIEEIHNSFKFERWEDAYDMMHSDSRKQITKENYVSKMKETMEGAGITDYSIENVKFLDAWTWETTDKEYANVATADVSLKVQAFGSEQTINQGIHFVKENGMWRWFDSFDD